MYRDTRNAAHKNTDKGSRNLSPAQAALEGWHENINQTINMSDLTRVEQPMKKLDFKKKMQNLTLRDDIRKIAGTKQQMNRFKQQEAVLTKDPRIILE